MQRCPAWKKSGVSVALIITWDFAVTARIFKSPQVPCLWAFTGKWVALRKAGSATKDPSTVSELWKYPYIEPECVICNNASAKKNGMELLIYHRTLEYPKLVCWVQLLAPHRTTKTSDHTSESIVQMLLELQQLGAMTAALRSLFQSLCTLLVKNFFLMSDLYMVNEFFNHRKGNWWLIKKARIICFY